MPDDLLLPAFALTLLANAVLVGAAIRALRNGRFDGTRGSQGAERDGDRGAAAATIVSPDGHVDQAAAGHGPPVRPIADEAADPPAARSVEVSETRLGESPASTPPAGSASLGPPEAKRRAARRTAARPDLGAISTAARSVPPETGSPVAPERPPAPPSSPVRRRARRRFAMPPLEHDARIERSLETFLGVGDAAPPVGGELEGDEPRTTAAGATAATTVALVAVVGAESDAARGPDAAWTEAVAIVERTLRGAARGGDDVLATGPRSFRIVLRGTGELAARAYLRRIRATVEPLLHASSPSLELVTATATVLDAPLEQAIELAERRLEATIRAVTANDDLVADADPQAAAD